MRPSVQLLLSTLLLVCFAAPALAQNQAAPVLDLAPAQQTLSLANNGTQVLHWTLTNSGPSDAAVAVAVEAPSGWTVRLDADDAAFVLPAQAPTSSAPGSRDIAVTVSIGPTARPGNGTLTLTATGTGQLAGQTVGQIGSDTATATVALVYIPPPPPPLPPPDYTWLYVTLSAVVAALLLALYLWRATQVRLKLSALELVERAGDRANFSVLVENRAGKVRKIDLRLRGLPSPWAGAIMVPHVLLDGRASTDLPATINIPREAAPASRRTVQVQARPHGLYPWLVRRRIAVRVVGEEPKAPLVPFYQPPTPPQ